MLIFDIVLVNFKKISEIVQRQIFFNLFAMLSNVTLFNNYYLFLCKVQ